VLIAPSLRPIYGDPDRLQQVIWNLLSNAIKFTAKGGAVKVRVGQVGSQAEIVVIDTGQGIEAELLPHIFDRFRQADSSTRRQYGGLGLGLAIVRHLVDLHGGVVTAESPGAGLGATFRVRLPQLAVIELEKETPSIAAAPAVDLTDVGVLVVDDERETLDLLTALLTGRGALVRSAQSVKEAMDELVGELPLPDVVISDIAMPGEDGFDLIRKIRRLPAAQGGSLPVIGLTAYARPEDRSRVLWHGFNMYLAKPAEAEELLVMVASLAGRIDWT
jgi:CheY-like chemotaxis protein/anti-sigma regulatory factor (Ser/Thr protein kinase)